MTTVFRYGTKELSINNAEAFIHDATVTSGDADDDTSTFKQSTILYVGIGRTENWTNEPNPDYVTDNSQSLNYQTHREMLGAKKVGPTDICSVTTRHDWTSGTVYSMWRDTDEDMYDRAWYVLTDQLNVYTCLFNNKGGTSTVKPTGFSTLSFETSDGYVWKYVYTIPLGLANKFLTTSYMPVRKLTTTDGTAEVDRQLAVQNASVNGAIEIVETVNVGSGYETVANGVVSAGGKTTLRLSTSAATGASPINNFYNGSSVYISTGTGAGQLRRIIDYDGTTRTLTVNTAFTTTPNTDSRAVISPTLTIVGDGSNAKGYCTVNTSIGSISGISMISKGTGFTVAEAYITANSVHGSGATANAVMSFPGGHGRNPVRELASDKVMINVQLDDNLGTSVNGRGYIPSNTEFRTITVFKDPMLKVDSSNAPIAVEKIANTSNSPTTIRMSTKLKVAYEQMDGSTPINAFAVNDVITNKRLLDRAKSGALEFVTELNPTQRNTAGLTNALRAANATVTFIRDAEDETDNSIYSVYINNVESYNGYAAFLDNDVILKSTGETEIATISNVQGPEANTYSGEILYTENVQAVLRDPDQVEDIKIILDF